MLIAHDDWSYNGVRKNDLEHMESIWKKCLLLTMIEKKNHHRELGPNKHGLVTYIQVNVYIGNTLSWLNSGWAFKTDVCWRLNNHISVISLHIFEFSSKKQWFNLLPLRLYCFIYWKFIRLYEHQPETWVPFLANFGTFSRKSSKINKKRRENQLFFTVTRNISASHTGSNL